MYLSDRRTHFIYELLKVPLLISIQGCTHHNIIDFSELYLRFSQYISRIREKYC